MKTSVHNYSNKKCPDRIFGKIKKIGANWKWTIIDKIREEMTGFNDDQKYKHLRKRGEQPAIVLILESPHSNEFNSSGKPIAPAMGVSGQNIYKYFCDIINGASSGNKQTANNLNALVSFLNNNAGKEICVYIVNSVQYQCSLGIKPICHIIKESNWVDEWFAGPDFDERCNILNKEAFFINLCTSGVFVPMKEMVKERLNALGITDNDCEGPHPSSWNRLKKIEFK